MLRKVTNQHIIGEKSPEGTQAITAFKRTRSFKERLVEIHEKATSTITKNSNEVFVWDELKATCDPFDIAERVFSKNKKIAAFMDQLGLNH